MNNFLLMPSGRHFDVLDRALDLRFSLDVVLGWSWLTGLRTFRDRAHQREDNQGNHDKPKPGGGVGHRFLLRTRRSKCSAMGAVLVHFRCRKSNKNEAAEEYRTPRDSLVVVVTADSWELFAKSPNKLLYTV